MQLTGLIREKGRKGTRNASSDFLILNTFSLEDLTPVVVVVVVVVVYVVCLLTF